MSTSLGRAGETSGMNGRMEEATYGRLDAPIGSHIVTPRRGYLHHGIYVGDGKVVHYAGLCRGLHSGPVEEVTLSRFAAGRTVRIVFDGVPNFDPAETVRRARSRLGEDRYRLFTNNCEHFCEWCLRGTPRSHQVEALLTQPRWALRALIGLIASVLELATLNQGVIDRSATHDYPPAAARVI
jgi:hypothetical protein